MMMSLVALSMVLDTLPAEWTFRTQTNLIGQPEAVAQFDEGSRPGEFLRVSCSALDGIRATFGLGYRPFGERATTAEPAAENLTLNAQEKLDVDAKLDPAEPLIWTYVATGTGAIKAAKFLAQANDVDVSSAMARAKFHYAPSAASIDEVLDACPFKG